MNENINFNEDAVLEMLLEQEESHFAGNSRAKAQAKIELKNKLKAKVGNDWWKPKNFIKYKKDYKAEKNEVVNRAVLDLKKDKAENRLDIKKDKWEAKTEAGKMTGSQILSSVLQKTNDSENASNPLNVGKSEDVSDKKITSATTMFGTTASKTKYVVIGVIAIVVIAFVYLKFKK